MTSDPIAFSLRQAAESDVDFLLDLRTRSMGPHQVAAGIVLSAQEHERRVRDSFECAEIIEVDDVMAGMWKVLRPVNEWRLMQIQLLPMFQARGIGGQLVRTLIAEATSAKVALTLTVLKNNPARRLYERLGFVVVSEGRHGFEMRLRCDRRTTHQ